MRDTIICLIGASGVGKTTVAKVLHDQGFNVIQSYTTRPQRSDDEWGHTFVSENLKEIFTMKPLPLPPESLREGVEYPGHVVVRNMPPGVIAHEVLYNGHHYWATVNQYRGKGVSIYVIDPKGAKSVKGNVKDADVIAVYLYADYSTLQGRLEKDRPKEQADHRLSEDSFVFEVVENDVAINTTFLKPEKVAERIIQCVVKGMIARRYGE